MIQDSGWGAIGDYKHKNLCTLTIRMGVVIARVFFYIRLTFFVFVLL